MAGWLAGWLAGRLAGMAAWGGPEMFEKLSRPWEASGSSGKVLDGSLGFLRTPEEIEREIHERYGVWPIVVRRACVKGNKLINGIN